MHHAITRRLFLKEAAALSAGAWVAGDALARESNSPNEKLRIGCIGIGGRGEIDSSDAMRFGDVVAICDIDDQRLENSASTKFPGAKRFNDYRKMLDEMGKSIDAVTVSTPDHTHASAALLAMRMGKHCFCQKPLTHSISEARLMAQAARDNKVATQMGNQGTSSDGFRKTVAYVKSGKLGRIKEVHVWTDRPIWPQGGPRPASTAAPSSVHWDLWLGPAPYRDYGLGYHPFVWRGWWDFGTGALGDMACHTFNMPYAALDLKNPTSIEAEHSGHNKDSYPAWSVIKFQFPATPSRPAIPVTWYDGGKRPSVSLWGGKDLPSSGSLIVGEKDTLYGHGDNCSDLSLLGGADPGPIEFVKSIGHMAEFARAARGGQPAMSNFGDYSGALAETVLLGNLAVWCGKGPGSDGKLVQWDSENLRASNAPELASLIKRDYRPGWMT